jgi:hypothetical protein
LGADEIAEARLRECYLNGVPEHRRAQELASELGLTA